MRNSMQITLPKSATSSGPLRRMVKSCINTGTKEWNWCVLNVTPRRSLNADAAEAAGLPDFKLVKYMKTWHENGQLASRTSFKKNGNIHSVKHWYTNGKLRSHRRYKNNVMHGKHICYFDTGMLKSIEYYKNGQSYRKEYYKRNNIAIVYRN